MVRKGSTTVAPSARRQTAHVRTDGTSRTHAPMEIVALDEMIRIPETAWSLSGFRDWATSEDFPRRGRISFIGGEIIVDMSPEEISTHACVKGETGRVLPSIIVRFDLGMFFPDRTLLTNVAVDLSTEPDSCFASYASIRSGRVRLVPREDRTGRRYMELEGTPDWILEILSKYSVRKDTVLLLEKYHKAGIPEYWLIDARGKKIKFTILIHKPPGYEPAPVRAGWQYSPVFRHHFRLDRKCNRVGFWQYTLHVKQK